MGNSSFVGFDEMVILESFLITRSYHHFGLRFQIYVQFMGMQTNPQCTITRKISLIRGHLFFNQQFSAKRPPKRPNKSAAHPSFWTAMKGRAWKWAPVDKEWSCALHLWLGMFPLVLVTTRNITCFLCGWEYLFLSTTGYCWEGKLQLPNLIVLWFLHREC